MLSIKEWVTFSKKYMRSSHWRKKKVIHTKYHLLSSARLKIWYNGFLHLPTRQWAYLMIWFTYSPDHYSKSDHLPTDSVESLKLFKIQSTSRPNRFSRGKSSTRTLNLISQTCIRILSDLRDRNTWLKVQDMQCIRFFTMHWRLNNYIGRMLLTQKRRNAIGTRPWSFKSVILAHTFNLTSKKKKTNQALNLTRKLCGIILRFQRKVMQVWRNTYYTQPQRRKKKRKNMTQNRLIIAEDLIIIDTNRH
jgi:hypothetical protein